MLTYRPGDDVGVLELWPFDNPASAYRVLAGTPMASGRLDEGGAPGVFECTEQGDELMTMLAGRCIITDLSNGNTVTLNPSDSLFIRDGMRVKWDVQEEVTKVFMGWKPDGY